MSITDALAESRLTRDLGAPQRIAVDSMGDVYVADPGRGGLAAFNLADGELVYRIPFVGVTSVAVDWQDRAAGRRAAPARRSLDRRGLKLLALDPREPLGAVTDVAVDTARRRYAVLYGDTSRILVHDETGTEIGAVGVAGDGPAELRRPQGVAFTPEGDLVVADSGQATIKVIGLDGTLRLSFGGNGTSAGRFVRLDDVEVGADGVIYASDAYQAWVQAFNPDGTLRETIGTYGDGLGRFRTPSGIAAAADYRKLIVASLNTPSLEVFRMRGDPVSARKPQPVLSTTAIGFPATPVGAASAARVVTLGNVGTAPLGMRRVVVNGEFRQTNDCGLALDPGATCSFSLTYVPETPGTATGSLDIETSANPGSLAVALTGEAFLAPTASLVPGQLAFADQRVGTTSAPQPATLEQHGRGSARDPWHQRELGLRRRPRLRRPTAGGGGVHHRGVLRAPVGRAGQRRPDRREQCHERPAGRDALGCRPSALPPGAARDPGLRRSSDPRPGPAENGHGRQRRRRSRRHQRHPARGRGPDAVPDRGRRLRRGEARLRRLLRGGDRVPTHGRPARSRPPCGSSSPATAST